jgi:ABC-type transport system involved in cytochrome bd biosynthesis fused ATPase/permease subunit
LGLAERLEEMGRALGEREAAHSSALDVARAKAEELHALVAPALERFHAAAAASGAPHLRISLSEPQIDEKHLRAVEFELRRGKHVAIVTVKSRGDLTLVGPFRVGKAEGPCRSFPIDAADEIESALTEFIGSFLEEAATP